MRKKLVMLSWVLLLISNIYLLMEITKPEIYITKISSEIKNPISIVSRLRICIDSGFQDAYYYISLLPYIAVVVISFGLLVFGLYKKNSDKKRK